MKILKIFLIISFIIYLSLSCNSEDNIINDPPCPPINIVPIPPYNSPAWHPSGEFIGFNYKPLKEIKYNYGEECQGEFIWESDSLGFWLINVDGTNMRRVLPFHLLTPTWSPDGSWIAFVSSDQIYKMQFKDGRFDKTSITQLTFQGRNYFPAWSPDGNWIAYDSDNESPNGGYRIWKMDSNGNKKSLTVNGRIPEWSHDMSHLVYKGLYTELYKFYFYNSDTVKITNLNSENRYLFYNSFPKYIPNAKKIAFTSQLKNALPKMYIADTNGLNITQISADGVDTGSGRPFDLSPDGNQIVYTKYDWNDWSYENGTIWLFDINSGIKTQLTFNNGPNK